MNIGIITQPLHGNYGGILQNLALQQVLNGMGHDVTTLQYEPLAAKVSIPKKFIHSIKKWINELRGYYRISASERAYISAESNKFISDHISLKKFNDFSQLEGIDCFIVGSDQVWRPYYSNVRMCFLDFCRGKKVKRIAYAASFGSDKWEYDENLTSECSKLIKEFDAVSVREISGVTLCNQYLKADAIHVLDPTLLVPVDIYNRVILNDSSSRTVVAYLLDIKQEKIDKVKEIASERGCGYKILKPYREFLTSGPKYIDDCKFMNPAEWLWYIKNAECVITDSFHGTVFSIIFHKDFVTISNPFRGNDRFKSLLTQLGLLSKLSDSVSSVTNKWISERVDWSNVDNKITDLREQSIKFLSDALRK